MKTENREITVTRAQHALLLEIVSDLTKRGRTATPNINLVRALKKNLERALERTEVAKEAACGSGVTYKDVMDGIRKLCTVQYGQSLQTNNADDLAAAFDDGMQTMLMHLERMGVIIVKT